MLRQSHRSGGRLPWEMKSEFSMRSVHPGLRHSICRLVVSIETDLRANEVRWLMRKDLILERRDGVIRSGELLVGRSKT